MIGPRYFFVKATQGEEESYLLLRAGERSLRDLLGYYDFRLLRVKPNGTRKYETLPDFLSEINYIRLKVNRMNRVSPTKRHNYGIDFHIEEVQRENIAKMKSKVKKLICNPRVWGRDHKLVESVKVIVEPL